jgi:hypothetical protein
MGIASIFSLDSLDPLISLKDSLWLLSREPQERETRKVKINGKLQFLIKRTGPVNVEVKLFLSG